MFHCAELFRDCLGQKAEVSPACGKRSMYRAHKCDTRVDLLSRKTWVVTCMFCKGMRQTAIFALTKTNLFFQPHEFFDANLSTSCN